MQAKLERLGVQAAVNEVLTPLEILGCVLDTHVGAASRVLAIGGPELEAAVVDGGHTWCPWTATAKRRPSSWATTSTSRTSG